VTPPAVVALEPFAQCDARTLWILELLYRDLSTDPFSIKDHLMVNFERTDGTDAGGAEPRPTVDAVRLKGQLLIDHPQVCGLILRKRRIVDIGLVVRVKQAGVEEAYSPSLRVKLGWADDHLAVSTGELEGAHNQDVHARLVRDVRNASGREIDPALIELPMQRILNGADLSETEDDLPSVFGQDDATATGQ
jgi:hypothetical protein